MADMQYPPGETPPPPFVSGANHEALNSRFDYIYAMLLLAADPSIKITPGTSVSPGRISATGATGGTFPTIQPLTVVDASAKDAQGNPHPGRVRVYLGLLGNLTPEEMNIPDSVLPNGTDNRCYLTMQNGQNYVYGKVLVDSTSGLYTAAHVYSVTSPEDPDSTYAYLLIAFVNFSNAKLQINQVAVGNQQLLLSFAATGDTINPVWALT